jgi:hypothetical protein
MRLRVVSSRSEIEDLSRAEQIVHLAFRASNTDIFRLLQSCPRVRAIQVPPSYRRTLSQAGEMFLEMQGVELIEGDVWGHRKDINEYYEINEDLLKRINEMTSGGMKVEDIAGIISEETRMSSSLVKYVISQLA